MRRNLAESRGRKKNLKVKKKKKKKKPLLVILQRLRKEECDSLIHIIKMVLWLLGKAQYGL